MKKFMRVQEAANMIGVSGTTLRRYVRQGKVEDLRSPSGQRIFTMDSIQHLLPRAPQYATVFYVRSSDGDVVKMENQESLLRSHNSEPTEVYRDKGSGLNDKRPSLQRLIRDAKKGRFNEVLITQKDRLTRFGFSYLEQLLNEYGVKITVVGEKEEKTIHDELIQDFLSLLASFSGKYYRLRGHEQSKKFLSKVQDEIQE